MFGRRGGQQAVSSLSHAYSAANKLGTHEHIVDGFLDIGVSDPNSPKNVAGPGEEALRVDRQVDENLRLFADRVAKKLSRTNDIISRIMVAALFISEVSGRSGTRATNLVSHYETLVLEKSEKGVMLLGDTLSPQGKKERKRKQTGAGMTRHRALLFKALADWLQFAECTLERPAPDGRAVHAWNAIQVNGQLYILDLLDDPGALYESGSQKAEEYYRQVNTWATTNQESQNFRTMPPSVLPELAGAVPRPAWHVEPWHIGIRREARLGKGGFGEVYIGVWAGQKVAIKEMKDAAPTDGDILDFILEISLLAQVNHPNIVRFWRGCVDLRDGARSLLCVTEYVDRGSLSTFLHGHGGPKFKGEVTLEQLLALGVGIGRGVHYLHQRRILHLDLKSPNVLIAAPWRAVLCDFGLAKIREQTVVNTTLGGVSPVWAAPEMFLNKDDIRVTEKADVYSFGIMLFELIYRKVPFSEIAGNALPNAKVQGRLPAFPQPGDAELQQLISLCLNADTSNRPTVPGVIARIHQFMRARNMSTNCRSPFGSGMDADEIKQQAAAIENERKMLETEAEQLKKTLEETRMQVSNAEENMRKQTDEVEKNLQQYGSLCEVFSHKVEENKFRCLVCRKLFCGQSFLHRHLLSKHKEEVLDARRRDQYFDGDVGMEDAVPASAGIQTSRGQDTMTVRGTSVLDFAKSDASAGLLEQAVALKADVNAGDEDGNCALHIAAKRGAVHAVQILLRAAANVQPANRNGFTALHYAAQEGAASIVRDLLAQRASPTPGTQKKDPAHLAAEAGQPAIVLALLDAQAHLEATTPDGETLLALASRASAAEAVDALIHTRASVNSVDRQRWTPLHEAARWAEQTVVNLLLFGRADIMARTEEGETVLHIVGDVGAAEVLLRAAADVNARDREQQTPLHVAVRQQDPRVCELLLADAAVEVNARDAKGMTPLDCARSDEVRMMLRLKRGVKGATR